MSTLQKGLLGFAIALAVGVGALFAWHIIFPPPPPPTQAGDFDSFEQDLAQRVAARFGADPKSVVVAPTEYKVGVLLEKDSENPSNAQDCVPTPMPEATRSDHLFPSYELNSKTAATLSVGSDALAQLTNATLDLSHTASLVYSIDEVNVALMDMKSVEGLMGNGACAAWVRANPGLRLVRGVVTGRMSFKLNTSNPGSVTAKLPKVVGATVSDGDSAAVTVTDDKPTQILEMIMAVPASSAAAMVPTAVPAPPVVAAETHPVPPTHMRAAIQHPHPGYQTMGPPAAPPPPPRPEPARQPPGGGWLAHVYLQQDEAASPEQGTKAAAALRAGWPGALVEGQVQRMPSAKMPGAAQVRFFNTGDAELAAQCRDMLKMATGIEARVVRVGLTAPPKQLEVWLPKAGH